MENTSGRGKMAAVPPEVDKWNWGAFLLTWIWGIGNNTFIAFLAFVPFVNIVMPFVLGAKGSIWAWQNRKWESVEEFKIIQRKWAKWALVVYAAMIAMFIGLFFVLVTAFKNTDAFKLAMSTLEASEEAAQIIGKPISAGMPSGSIETSGPDGHASLSFSVSGPKGKGTVFMKATMSLGKWEVDRLVLEQEGTGRRIDLVQPSRQ